MKNLYSKIERSSDLEDIIGGSRAHPVEECSFATPQTMPRSFQIPPPGVISFQFLNDLILQIKYHITIYTD